VLLPLLLPPLLVLLLPLLLLPSAHLQMEPQGRQHQPAVAQPHLLALVGLRVVSGFGLVGRSVGALVGWCGWLRVEIWLLLVEQVT
jgi:hypothetical protein